MSIPPSTEPTTASVWNIIYQKLFGIVPGSRGEVSWKRSLFTLAPDGRKLRYRDDHPSGVHSATEEVEGYGKAPHNGPAVLTGPGAKGQGPDVLGSLGGLHPPNSAPCLGLSPNAAHVMVKRRAGGLGVEEGRGRWTGVRPSSQSVPTHSTDPRDCTAGPRRRGKANNGQ